MGGTVKEEMATGDRNKLQGGATRLVSTFGCDPQTSKRLDGGWLRRSGGGPSITAAPGRTRPVRAGAKPGSSRICSPGSESQAPNLCQECSNFVLRLPWQTCVCLPLKLRGRHASNTRPACTLDKPRCHGVQRYPKNPAQILDLKSRKHDDYRLFSWLCCTALARNLPLRPAPTCNFPLSGIAMTPRNSE